MHFSENGEACPSLDDLFQELVGSPYEAVLLIDWTSSEVVACNEAAARMLRADGVDAVRGAARRWSSCCGASKRCLPGQAGSQGSVPHSGIGQFPYLNISMCISVYIAPLSIVTI